MPTIKKTSRQKSQRGSQREIRQKIYNTRRWQRLRLAQLKAQPLCAICEAEGRTTEAEHVHHLRSFTDAPTVSERCAIAYDPDNLQSLCAECHNRLHQPKRTRGKKKTADAHTASPSSPRRTDLGGRGVNLSETPPVNPPPVVYTQTVVSEVSEALKKKGDAPSSSHGYTPPQGLRADTLAEIDRIACYLDETMGLQSPDITALNLLAHTLDRYHRATAIIAREGELVFTSQGKPLRHPLVKVAGDAQVQVIKLLEEFGLTPRSREKIKSLQSGGDEADPLALFLSSKP